MTRDQLIHAYADWLGQYQWAIFATHTFRGFPSSSKGDRLFRTWISELQKQEGKKDFRWVRIAEHGAFRDNLHYHSLIGGLRDMCRLHWLRRWDELAGDSVLTYYRPDYNRDDKTFPSRLNAAHSDSPTGAIPYILKTAHPDRDFEIEFQLPPIACSRIKL